MPDQTEKQRQTDQVERAAKTERQPTPAEKRSEDIRTQK